MPGEAAHRLLGPGQPSEAPASRQERGVTGCCQGTPDPSPPPGAPNPPLGHLPVCQGLELAVEGAIPPLPSALRPPTAKHPEGSAAHLACISPLRLPGSLGVRRRSQSQWPGRCSGWAQGRARCVATTTSPQDLALEPPCAGQLSQESCNQRLGWNPQAEGRRHGEVPPDGAMPDSQSSQVTRRCPS